MILNPALDYSLERKHITSEEREILKLAFEKGEIKASDINSILHKEYPTEISRIIAKLKKNGMLMNKYKKNRIYIPAFADNYLTRGVIAALGKNRFIPFKE